MPLRDPERLFSLARRFRAASRCIKPHRLAAGGPVSARPGSRRVDARAASAASVAGCPDGAGSVWPGL